MSRPAGIVEFTPSPEHFPFESKWFDSSVGPVHYVDEGTGRPLVLLHGNPDWSFLYRKIITGLEDRFRCLAVDYPGFGLSAHPAGYGYTAAEHAAVVRELIEHLNPSDLVIMGQDWGGPIGMDIASRMPDRVTGLVMGNTWFWPADELLMKTFSLLMGSWPMQRLITERNFFVSPLMKRTLRADVSDEEFSHYVDVVPTPASRRGIAEFPRQIRAARPWLAELETRVHQSLRHHPMLLIFGLKDRALARRSVIDRWRQAFPQSTLVELPEAGHYIQEDAPDRIVTEIAAAFVPEGRE